MIGIIVWILRVWSLIIRRSIGVQQYFFRLSSLFDATSFANIIVGLFLVMSDQFFGIGTSSSRFALSALDLSSAWAAFDYVIPLGIYFSLISMMSYAIVALLRKKHLSGSEFLGWSLWSLAMMIVTTQQHYPRHIVTEVFGTTFDIKQYFFLLLSLFFLIWFASLHLKGKKFSSH
jgi:hypothetical protein